MCCVLRIRLTRGGGAHCAPLSVKFIKMGQILQKMQKKCKKMCYIKIGIYIQIRKRLHLICVHRIGLRHTGVPMYCATSWLRQSPNLTQWVGAGEVL